MQSCSLIHSYACSLYIDVFFLVVSHVEDCPVIGCQYSLSVWICLYALTVVWMIKVHMCIVV